MQQYHNANASDVDTFSTHTDGTKGQPESKGEGNCYNKNADISYKSAAVVGLEPYKGIHVGTHPGFHTDRQHFTHQR
jgi:hypothetical protein